MTRWRDSDVKRKTKPWSTTPETVGVQQKGKKAGFTESCLVFTWLLRCGSIYLFLAKTSGVVVSTCQCATWDAKSEGNDTARRRWGATEESGGRYLLPRQSECEASMSLA